MDKNGNKKPSYNIRFGVMAIPTIVFAIVIIIGIVNINTNNIVYFINSIVKQKATIIPSWKIVAFLINHLSICFFLFGGLRTE